MLEEFYQLGQMIEICLFLTRFSASISQYAYSLYGYKKKSVHVMNG